MSRMVTPTTETGELSREDQALIGQVVAPGAAGRAGVLEPTVQALGPSGIVLLAGALVMLAVLVAAAVGAIPGPNVATMTVYLPVAHKSMNVLMVVSAGFAVGILSGMTGVGGGFLMTPLLMTIGVPSAVAVGTDSTQIAGTGSSGAVAHYRLGNVDVKLGLTILVGSLVGGTVGVQVVRILREMGSFDFWVRVIYIVMLAGVGIPMLRESLRIWARSALRRTTAPTPGQQLEDLRGEPWDQDEPKRTGGIGRFSASWPLQTEFKKSGMRASYLFPLALGLAIGVLTAIMGVGGGFIMVPAMIYVLGVPTHVAVGTSLFQIVPTSGNVAFQQAITNHNVDVLLAMLLMMGAAIGAQLGARMSDRLEGYQLRTVLGVIVILVMLKLLADLLLTPSSLFGLATVSGGGL